MASYRRPKGTVVRTLPDWNLNNCAAISIVGTEIPGGTTEAGLVNDATDGRFLVLWHLGISHIAGAGADPATMSAVAQLYATLGLLPYTQNTPLNPTAPAPPGSGWFNATSPGVQTTGELIPNLWGNAYFQWPHDYPVCVIPPGYSASVVFNAPATNFGVTAASFMWEAVRGL
jgi:hypothetical protein